MKAIINTQLSDAYISVDKKDYRVIDKTIGTDKAVIAVRDELESGQITVYEGWLKTLQLLLGDDVVNELIPDLNSANPDYIERLFYGTVEAYNANSTAFKAEREKKKTDDALAAINRVTKPIKDLSPMLEVVKANKAEQ